MVMGRSSLGLVVSGAVGLSAGGYAEDVPKFPKPARWQGTSFAIRSRTLLGCQSVKLSRRGVGPNPPDQGRLVVEVTAGREGWYLEGRDVGHHR